MALTLVIRLSGIELDEIWNIHQVLFKDHYSISKHLVSPINDSSGISILTKSDIPIPSPTMTYSDHDESSKDDSFMANGSQEALPEKRTLHSRLTEFQGLEISYRRLIEPSVSQLKHTGVENWSPLLEPLKPANDNNIKVIYENRNILNLEANLRSIFWQLTTPTIPRNFTNFFRVCETIMIYCEHCNFSESS